MLPHFIGKKMAKKQALECFDLLFHVNNGILACKEADGGGTVVWFCGGWKVMPLRSVQTFMLFSPLSSGMNRVHVKEEKQCVYLCASRIDLGGERKHKHTATGIAHRKLMIKPISD